MDSTAASFARVAARRLALDAPESDAWAAARAELAALAATFKFASYERLGPDDAAAAVGHCLDGAGRSPTAWLRDLEQRGVPLPPGSARTARDEELRIIGQSYSPLMLLANLPELFAPATPGALAALERERAAAAAVEPVLRHGQRAPRARGLEGAAVEDLRRRRLGGAARDLRARRAREVPGCGPLPLRRLPRPRDEGPLVRGSDPRAPQRRQGGAADLLRLALPGARGVAAPGPRRRRLLRAPVVRHAPRRRADRRHGRPLARNAVR
mmetsp:Transcript_5575/g.18975  ORF Transcript_5575/g.18975 Transcript_5575/m.18975 type:complete len:269 (+) Transcript_5575:644-1450(+)